VSIPSGIPRTVESGEQSPTDLLRLAAAGSPEAWEELVRRHRGLVDAVVRRMGLRDGDAADAARITWLGLLQHPDRMHDPERLPGWLATTARRVSIRIAMRAADMPLPVDKDDEAVVAGAATERADGPLLDHQLDERLERALASVPPHHRALLEQLVSEEGLSDAEVAARMHVPTGNIGPTRGRALRLQRDRMETTDELTPVAVAG
jgi:RNA polymerase sigma factor (sigma-70 family)